jgi:hypothetical protein
MGADGPGGAATIRMRIVLPHPGMLPSRAGLLILAARADRVGKTGTAIRLRAPWRARQLARRGQRPQARDDAYCTETGRSLPRPGPPGHGPHWEGESRTPLMDGEEILDSAVVARRSPNKAGKPGAELMEPRARLKENAEQRNPHRTQSLENFLQSLGHTSSSEIAWMSNIQGKSRVR